jgi:hypothetical protein
MGELSLSDFLYFQEIAFYDDEEVFATLTWERFHASVSHENNVIIIFID